LHLHCYIQAGRALLRRQQGGLMGLVDFRTALERAAHGQERREWNHGATVTLPGGKLVGIWQVGRGTRQREQLWAYTIELWGCFYQARLCSTTSEAWRECADRGFL
jgi:hypothetical protein